jgi:hypothetical protein
VGAGSGALLGAFTAWSAVTVGSRSARRSPGLTPSAITSRPTVPGPSFTFTGSKREPLRR